MVMGEVKKTFNPEFINRVDEIIVFDPLSDDDLRRIAGLLVDNLNQHLVDRRLKIEVTKIGLVKGASLVSSAESIESGASWLCRPKSDRSRPWPPS